MTNVAVIGAQWGDEGKGKIVDWLSERADIVVRFQGGHNAGHTLVIDGVTYKLSLLPSGCVRPGKMSIIGPGVVVDPWHLLKEIETVAAQGVTITPQNLRVADTAALILPYHSRIDRLREDIAGTAKIGTTGRGIGPAYEDKVGRRAVRVADLSSAEDLERRLDRALVHYDALFRGLGAEPVDRDQLMHDLLAIAPKILPFAEPVGDTLDQAVRDGKRILFEGAQGVMLDVDQGTYPFVTSSSTGAGGAVVGSGLGPKAIGYVLGICKAYTTRVGSGPFPTELTDEIGETLGRVGHEFGVVTGRKRRCGWFDAVLVRRAVRRGGIDGLALTKLDVLDGFAELKVCVAYELDGVRIDALPPTASAQARCQPIFETLPGWQDTTAGARSYADLPAEAVKYIRRIEELIGCPVAVLSTSPKREDTISLKDPFAG